MTPNGWFQMVFFVVVLVVLVWPLGAFMARVYTGEAKYAQRALGWLERLIYKLSGIDPNEEMSWRKYALVTLVFNFAGLAVVYGIQRLQHLLPDSMQPMAQVSPDSAFNTAVSFASNTNWQGYAGETTMSFITQMLALTVQNFVSAATGMAVLVALIRGFSRKSSLTIGNFWQDMTRSTIYVLLPLSLVVALFLVSQGVVQTFTASQTVTLMQPTKDANGQAVTQQVIAMGPAASQIAIKQLGTNGGGFFNANSAHPLENPTPASNLVELLAILLIPAALCYTFGHMVGDTRQGWALLAAMLVIFAGLLIPCVWFEQQGNPALPALGVDQSVQGPVVVASNPYDIDPATRLAQSGGNMEGKEVRFGIVNSGLWATATTAASNGSVNAMHDSFTPLGGLIPMWLMQLGEVVFGGAGSGLYGMVIFALKSVFIAGLMVGRTPEYLGKKIEAFEIKMASLVILLPCACVLIGTAIAIVIAQGTSSIYNPGAHGLSEVLYAFSSASNNNGSAFGGLSANTPFYNTALGLVMLVGRYWIIIPVLAIAGSLATKKTVPVSAGTLPTHTPLFVTLLVSVVLIIGALTFIPALALGPIAEHLMMLGH